MAIHLVQRASALATCTAVAAERDCIVLLGDGVAAVLQGASNCYASDTDLAERGLADRIAAGITPITDQELVDLCAAHAPVVSWGQP